MTLAYQRFTAVLLLLLLLLDDVGISAFHSCVVVVVVVVVDIWQSLQSHVYYCLNGIFPCITAMHLLTQHCL
jgi:hypothetical protein